MPALAAVFGLIALGAAIGGCLAGSRPRRLAGLAAAVLAAGLPFLVDPGERLGRFAAALVGGMLVLRAVDLFRERPSRPALHRVWHLLAGYDTRAAARTRPTLRLGALAELGLFAGLAAGAFGLGMVVAAGRSGWEHWLLRWGGALVFSVAATEVAARAIEVSWALVGVRVPKLHDAPYRARSVREFWGRRWNRIVGGWLRANCYLPLARRRRPRLGTLAAFAASAALHGYLILAGLGGAWLLVYVAFFLIQGLLIELEDALGVPNWPPPLGRAFTIVVLALCSPLFTEPMIRLIEP